MSKSARAVVKSEYESVLDLYQKARRLGTAVFKNKNSFLSDVELKWFGGPDETFPFAIDSELNVCTRMPHQRVLDKFRSAIFPEPPANSNVNTVKVNNCQCGYVEIRGVNDADYNVLKTAEYLLQREWVGVVHTSDGAKLYLLPTSSLTHHLGMTSPNYVYPRMLHGLFVKKERNGARVKDPTPSSVVATPPSSSTTDANNNGSEHIPSIITPKSSTRKHKTVSFADQPTNIDDEKPSDDITSTTSEAKPSPNVAAAPSSEHKTLESAADHNRTESENRFASPSKTSLTSSSSVKEPVASLTPPRVAEKSGVMETLSPLAAIRDVLSDEESVASSVSSFASDSSSLPERPTRRRRGRSRRGRGKRVLALDEGTEAAGSPNGRAVKTSARGRGRRRGRGGRSAPVEIPRQTSEDAVVDATVKVEALCSDSNDSGMTIVKENVEGPPSMEVVDGSSKADDTVSEYEDSNKTGEMAAKAGLERSASVEMVEESMKAEDAVSDRTLYDDLSRSGVTITKVTVKESEAVSTIAQLLTDPSPFKADSASPVSITLPKVVTVKLPIGKSSKSVKQEEKMAAGKVAVSVVAEDSDVRTSLTKASENSAVQASVVEQEIVALSPPSTPTPLSPSEDKDAVGGSEHEPVAQVVSVEDTVEPMTGDEYQENADIEQEVISQDVALGDVEEYIVLEGSGGQYVRPPKRVSLAEYKRRRTTVDDLRQRRDSTGSESSQAASDREFAHPTVVRRSDKPTASDKVVAALSTTMSDSQAEKSVLDLAISEALRAELESSVESDTRTDKKATQPATAEEREASEGDSPTKDKVAVKPVTTVESEAASSQVSSTVSQVGVKDHTPSTFSVTSATSSSTVQSKDTVASVPPSVTNRITAPSAPSSYISPIVTPHQQHRFAPSSAPSPNFPTILPPPPHNTLPPPPPPPPPGHAPWGYGPHLFYPPANIPGLGPPAEHWPFGHSFYHPGAPPPHGGPLDYPGLPNLGYNDALPCPPPRSPDSSRTCSTNRSRSRTRSRSRSRSRSLTRSRSMSRSRSRSPIASSSLRSRSRSRSRNRSPLRRNRGGRLSSRSPQRTSRSPRRISHSPSSRSQERLNQVLVQHLSEHLQMLHSLQDKERTRRDSGIQASPTTSSLSTQIGKGFKLRSVSSQTRRCPPQSSRGIQSSPRVRDASSQVLPRQHTTGTQTSARKKSVSCQTTLSSTTNDRSPLFQALLQNQDFSEFDDVLEEAKSNFAKSIGLTVEEFSDDDFICDESSSSERSNVELPEEEGEENDDTLQTNVPSPVISGASNISDGEWSDLEGSNNNSRKGSQPTTPTDSLDIDIFPIKMVADVIMGPEQKLYVAEETSSQQPHADPLHTSSPICAHDTSKDHHPESLSRTPVPDQHCESFDSQSTIDSAMRTGATTQACTDTNIGGYPDFLSLKTSIDECHESPISASATQQQMHTRTVGDGSPDFLSLETVTKQCCESVDSPSTSESVEHRDATSQERGSVVHADQVCTAPSVNRESSEKADKVSSPHRADYTEASTLSKAVVQDTPPSSEEPVRIVSTQSDKIIGPSLPPAKYEVMYGPVLPPASSSTHQPLPSTTVPVYGPPLPPPRSSYDVPLPTTYGPSLPPSMLESDGIKSPSRKIPTGASKKDKSGEAFEGDRKKGNKDEVDSEVEGVWQVRSFSLPPFKMSGGNGSNSNSRHSTPLLSNKSSPLSSPGDGCAKSASTKHKSKRDQSPAIHSESPTNVKKKRNSSSNDSDDQYFKSPSRKRRRKSRISNSPEETSRRRESTSEERNDNSSVTDPKPKKLPSVSDIPEPSTANKDTPKAASSSPPCQRKFGADPVLFPVKKKPMLTAQELLEKVRAKRLKSPSVDASKQLGSQTEQQEQTSPASTPDSPGMFKLGEAQVSTGDPLARVPATAKSSIDMDQLMMNFRQHMAAKKIRDGSWMHGRPPVAMPFIGPPPLPPMAPPPLRFPLPPLPPVYGGPVCTTTATHPVSCSNPCTPTSSECTAATSNVSSMGEEISEENSIDAQLEAVLESQLSAEEKSNGDSKSNSPDAPCDDISDVADIPPSSTKVQSVEKVSEEGNLPLSPSAEAPVISVGNSCAPPHSDHFLATELVQHQSCDDSGTIGPAETLPLDSCPADGEHPSRKEQVEEELSCAAMKSDSLAEQPVIGEQDQSRDENRVGEGCHDDLYSKSELANQSEPANELANQSELANEGATSSVPKCPVSIMYQSSELDPISPIGLSEEQCMDYKGELASSVEDSEQIPKQESPESSLVAVPEHTSALTGNAEHSNTDAGSTEDTMDATSPTDTHGSAPECVMAVASEHMDVCTESSESSSIVSAKHTAKETGVAASTSGVISQESHAEDECGAGEGHSPVTLRADGDTEKPITDTVDSEDKVDVRIDPLSCPDTKKSEAEQISLGERGQLPLQESESGHSSLGESGPPAQCETQSTQDLPTDHAHAPQGGVSAQSTRAVCDQSVLTNEGTETEEDKRNLAAALVTHIQSLLSMSTRLAQSTEMEQISVSAGTHQDAGDGQETVQGQDETVCHDPEHGESEEQTDVALPMVDLKEESMQQAGTELTHLEECKLSSIIQTCTDEGRDTIDSTKPTNVCDVGVESVSLQASSDKDGNDSDQGEKPANDNREGHEASSKDTVASSQTNKDPSSKVQDYSPTTDDNPSEGNESRELSPEVLRGKCDTASPSPTDMSGENFTISPSPSNSPSKLSSSLSVLPCDVKARHLVSMETYIPTSDDRSSCTADVAQDCFSLGNVETEGSVTKHAPSDPSIDQPDADATHTHTSTSGSAESASSSDLLPVDSPQLSADVPEPAHLMEPITLSGGGAVNVASILPDKDIDSSTTVSECVVENSGEKSLCRIEKTSRHHDGDDERDNVMPDIVSECNESSNLAESAVCLPLTSTLVERELHVGGSTELTDESQSSDKVQPNAEISPSMVEDGETLSAGDRDSTSATAVDEKKGEQSIHDGETGGHSPRDIICTAVETALAVATETTPTQPEDGTVMSALPHCDNAESTQVIETLKMEPRPQTEVKEMSPTPPVVAKLETPPTEQSKTSSPQHSPTDGSDDLIPSQTQSGDESVYSSAGTESTSKAENEETVGEVEPVLDSPKLVQGSIEATSIEEGPRLEINENTSPTNMLTDDTSHIPSMQSTISGQGDPLRAENCPVPASSCITTISEVSKTSKDDEETKSIMDYECRSDTPSPTSHVLKVSEKSYRRSQSPLLISIPSSYCSQHTKRAIKGPSERFRTNPKTRKKSRKPLIVSLPLPLYWRKVDKLESLKVLKRSELSLASPTATVQHLQTSDGATQIPQVSTRTVHEQSSPSSVDSSLIVSYPISSITRGSRSIALVDGSGQSHQSENERNIPVVEICYEEADKVTMEEAEWSRLLPFSNRGDEQLPTNPDTTDSPSPVVLRSSPTFTLKPRHSSLSSPVQLTSSVSVQTESIPKPRPRRKRKRKRLGSVVTPVVDNTSTHSVSAEGGEQFTACGTCIEFVLPEDDTLYENRTTAEPHVATVGPEQGVEDRPTSTTIGDIGDGIASPAQSPTTPVTATSVVTNQPPVFIGSSQHHTRLLRRPRRLSAPVQPHVMTNSNNNCTSTQSPSETMVYKEPVMTVEAVLKMLEIDIQASHVDSVGTAKPPSSSDSQSVSHVDSPSDDGTRTGSQLSQGGSHDSKQTLDRQTPTDKPTRPTSLPTRATSRCVNLTGESVISPKEDFISPVFQPDRKRIVVARKLTDCELQSKGIESQSVVPKSPTSESVNSPKEDLISPVSQPDKKRIVVARILTDSELQSKYVASQSVVPESPTSESAKSPKEDLISPVFESDKKRMVVARKLSDCEIQSNGVALQSIVPESPTSESAKSSKEDLISPVFQPDKKRIVVARKLTDSESQSEDVASPSVVPESPTSESGKSLKSQKEDLVSQPGKKRIVVARKLTDSESQSEDVASPSVVPESPTSESGKSLKSQKEDLVSQPGKKRIVVARKLTDSESQSEDVASPSVIPESPQDLSILKERDDQLPKISQFMDRCKQTEVPYISPETPPQVECVAKSTTSVAFPELSRLLKSNVFAKKHLALTRLRTCSFPPGPYTTTPTSTLSEDPVTTVSGHDAKAHIPGRGSLTEKKIDVPGCQVGEKGLKEEGSKGHPSSRQSEEVSCTSGSPVDRKASQGANASNSNRLSRLTVEEIVAKHAEKCLDTASVKSPDKASQTSTSLCIIPSKKSESSTPGTLSTSTDSSRDSCQPLSTNLSVSTSVDSSTTNACTVHATSTVSGMKLTEGNGQIADTGVGEVADSTVQVMKQIQSDKSASIAESLTDEPVQCLPARSCTTKPSMDVQLSILPQKPDVAAVKKKASSVPPAGPPTKRSRLTESRDSTVPPRKHRIKQNESVRKSRSLSPIRAPTSRLRAKSVASSKEGCQFEGKSRHNSGTKSIAVKRSLSDGDAYSMRERGHDYDSSSVSKRHRLDSGRKSPPLTSTSKTNDRRSRSSRVSVSPARDRLPEQPSCSRIKSRASSVSSCECSDWDKEKPNRGTERDRERHSSSKLSYRRSRESSPVGFRPEPTYYVDHEHRPPSPWPPHDHWYNHSPPLLERHNVRRASSSLLGPPPVPLPRAPQRSFIYSPPPPLYHEPLPHLYGGSLPLPYGPLARARSVYDQRTRDYDYATDVRYGRRGPPAVPPPPPHDWYRMHGDRYYQ